jgi:hypothetical protein
VLEEAMALANQVAIIGAGTIRVGENFHQPYTDMVAHTLDGPGAVSCVVVLGQP